MRTHTTDFRIGVFTPHIDGEYFGKILTSIYEETRTNGAQLTIIQTQMNHPNDTPINYPLFIDNLDGCILILDAVSEHTLSMLKQRGKPIVSIGFLENTIPCHSVLIDNRNGVKEAVLHLIDHGHEHIAFIGAFKQFDQCERFEAYKEALEERRIALNPELVHTTYDNSQQAGADAARDLLRKGATFTAAVSATDLNAMGFMIALRELGYSIPRDFAIVGFNDIEQAANDTFSLTTVRQDHSELARTAFGVLFRMLTENVPRSGITKVPTAFIRRTSCGCPPSIRSVTENLMSNQNTIEELRSSLRRLEYNNYELMQGLIRVTSDEKIDLADIFMNSSHWGYLALWDTEFPERKELVIDRVFSKRGERLPDVGQRFSVTAFPALDSLPASTSSGGSDIIIVHPIKNEKHDWGFLVLVGPLETLNYLFVNNLGRHSYTLLAAALDREFLFQRIRSIADRLEIVSKTTNDGIWDWNMVTNKIEWSPRIYSMLGQASNFLTDDPQSFLDLIHPQDLPAFKACVLNNITLNTPYQIEFRIRQCNDTYLWLYGAGEIVRDSSGQPTRIIGSFTDITKKKSDEARIVRLAYHDVLTGLPNRLFFLEHLQEALADSKQSGRKLAVMLIDLDRFKIINDTLGHPAGDKLLQHTGEMLRKSIRPQDLIARLGGDEFIIALPDIGDLAEIEQLADLIFRHIAEPLTIDGQETFNSASIGASLYPDHSLNAEFLIKYADMAMYKAKENGRNQLFLYTAELSSKVEQTFNLGNNLRKAIERSEFVLHFQPQVDLRSGAIIGVEALVRWRSPEHGVIPPAEFIPYAEETGLIVPISKWVLREACQRIKHWQASGLHGMVMSVNISAQHFCLGGFSKWVMSVLTETGVEPSSICLEITETTAIQDMEHSAQMLKELANYGLHIAIDDFGTGHSSLVLLKRLPIQTVKIDKSFIRDMTSDQDDASIVKAVIAMSHSLGLSVIAEGVEMQQQLEHLKALDCDYIQGYYVGRPMTAEQLESFFKVYPGL